MKKLLIGLFVFGSISVSFGSNESRAYSGPLWCGDYTSITDHPLSWSKLELKIDTYLEHNDYESAYQAVLAEYDAAYGSQNAVLMDELYNKVMAYLERRQVQGERPFDWQTTINPRRNSEMLILGSNEDIVHEVSCESDAWLGTSSAEVAVFYLAYAMKRIASDNI